MINKDETTVTSVEQFKSLSPPDASIVRKIELYNDEFPVLSKALFVRFPNLEELYLEDCNVVELHGDVFEDLDKLHTVSIKNRNSSVSLNLPGNLFRHNPFLNKVVLESCGIDDIPYTLFQECTWIEHCSFRDNWIEHLPRSLFSTCKDSLKTVSFARNRIDRLPEHFLTGSKQLQSADFSINNLTYVPDEFFEGCTKLETVNFAVNYLNMAKRRVFGLTFSNTHAQLITEVD